MAFFDLEGAGLAIRRTGFDQEELFETLVRLIRSQNPLVSLRAITRFTELIRDIALLNGRITATSIEHTSQIDSETEEQIRRTTRARLLINRLEQAGRSVHARQRWDHRPGLPPGTGPGRHLEPGGGGPQNTAGPPDPGIHET